MVLSGFQSITGLGYCPSDWLVKSADDVTSKITKGTTPPKTEIINDSKIPFLRVNNLGFNGELNTSSDMIFVTQEAHNRFLARSVAYPDDILMNIVGPPLGKIAMLNQDFDEYNMNQAIVLYRTEPSRVDKNYFLNFLSSELAQQWLQSRSKKTSGQQNLTIQLCKELPVPLPPLKEQQKIANILSTWDKAVSTTQRLVDSGKLQKKALMQQLLTGKKRLLDDSGKQFEVEWSKNTLSNLCQISTGKRDVNEGSPDGKYPFYTCAKEHTFSDSYSFDCEALLIAGNGNIGTTHYYNGKFEAYQRTYVLKDFEAINVEYLFQFLLYALNQEVERNKQHGAMPYIKVGFLNNFTVLNSSLEEQQKIATVLTNADKEIDLLEQQLADLQQEKKALMQQLLTGKRRVKVEMESESV